MAEREDVKKFIDNFYDRPSDEILKRFSNDNAGICCMMKYLANSEKPVSAGEISRFMKVSTARVSVLLKKMNEKGLVICKKSSNDARKLMISLSEKGKEEDRKHDEEMLDFFGQIIDEVGKERMEEFVSVFKQIRNFINEKINTFDD